MSLALGGRASLPFHLPELHQRVDNSAENEVFSLLFGWKFGKWDHTWVLLLFCVLRRAVFPTGCLFLGHPAFMNCFRPGVRIVHVKTDPVHCTTSHPVGSVFPWRLAVVPQSLAIGPVNFVANFCDFFNIHRLVLIIIKVVCCEAVATIFIVA